MTVSPITELSSMFSQGVSPTAPVSQGNTDFQSMIDNARKKNDEGYINELPVASSKMDKVEDNKTKYNEPVKNDSATDKLKAAEKNTQENVKDNKDSDSLSVRHKDVADNHNSENAKVTGELKDKILNEAAEDLGIDVEELMDILANLGLTAADLVNPENVSLLVANVKADGDMMALVTDENITNVVMNLNAAIGELVTESAEALNISPELMKEMVVLEEPETAEFTVAENVNSISEPVVTALQTRAQSLGNDKEIIRAGDIEEVVEAKDYDENQQLIDVKTVTEETADNTSNNSTSDKHQEDGRQENRALNQNVNQLVGQTFTDNQQINLNDVKPAEPQHYTSVDPEEILSQVRDSIRANVKADVTEISMQLNPESLGNVGLTVSAKEGNITAFLTAQNESVQAALESQVAILKETLEQQGVKVEAIEVMVGSHEFEQNLEQGNDRNDAQEKMAAELKKATRKLNINDILADDNIEGLDEAEEVTVKMMAADGNQMDYKV